MMNLPSTRPYLLRGIYEWCTDNGFTPYIAVAVDDRTVVPREHVRDGQIVLNVSAEATSRLVIGNEMITFVARFGGAARELSVPMDRVAAIYARENGAGMAFDVNDELHSADDQTPDVPASTEERPDPESPTPPSGRPKLQRIK